MPEAHPPAIEAARAVLRRTWGFADFRRGQREAVEAALAGRDVLAILPTGGGKSVCYQVPALVQGGLTLVVSPLIALMQDQVVQLQARGVPAAFINSTLSAREIDQRWTDAEFGRYRLLYVAPERLESEVFRARAGRLPVRLLAVDEAHCVSEWGHHFRPSYLGIPAARTLLGDPPTIAVTATATPEVRRDVIEHLALRDPQVLVKGFDRPEIVWSIFRAEDKRGQVLKVLEGVPGPGLVYTATRRGVETWAAWLAGQGERVVAYHGGMDMAAREQAQAAWIQGDARVVVATNAFGMGIDKADVRFVIHADAPGSIEAYYQEAGRAGRDGARAYAVLLFHPNDEATQRALIAESHPDAKAVAAVYDAVCNLAQIPLGALPEGPVAVDPEAVVRLTGFAPSRVSTAVELIVRQGVWQAAPARRHHALIHFLQPADAVRAQAARLENAALAAFIGELLRTVHADAFGGWWEIDLRLLERRTGLGRLRLVRGLAFLTERGLIDWRPPERSLRVSFTEPRTRRLPVDDLAVRRARRRAEARLDDLLRYVRSVTCRRQFLLAYFGEHRPDRCGACDVCLGRHEPVVVTPDDEPLMRHLLQQIDRGVPRGAWFDDPPPDHRLDGLLDWLVQERFLEVEALPEAHYRATEKARTLMEQWAPREDGSTGAARG